MRLFYATTTKLWWLEISDADRDVTLSQICLRPGVWHRLSGKIPGYAGAGAVGVARLRPNEPFGDLHAFAGSFGLFFYDETESD